MPLGFDVALPPALPGGEGEDSEVPSATRCRSAPRLRRRPRRPPPPPLPTNLTRSSSWTLRVRTPRPPRNATPRRASSSSVSMAQTTRLHRYAYADYVGIEVGSSGKHEFFDGEIYAMAGGTEDHSALSVAVTAALLGAAAAARAAFTRRTFASRSKRSASRRFPTAPSSAGPCCSTPRARRPPRSTPPSSWRSRAIRRNTTIVGSRSTLIERSPPFAITSSSRTANVASRFTSVRTTHGRRASRSLAARCGSRASVSTCGVDVIYAVSSVASPT